MEIDCVFVLDVVLSDIERMERSIKDKLSYLEIPDDSEYEALNKLRGQLRATPGVSELMKLAAVEDAEFGEHWLDRKRCILQIDHQVKSIEVSRMRIPAFAEKLLEIRRAERSGERNGEWSEYDSPAKWCKRFNWSDTKFRSWCKANPESVQKETSKWVRIRSDIVRRLDQEAEKNPPGS